MNGKGTSEKKPERGKEKERETYAKNIHRRKGEKLREERGEKREERGKSKQNSEVAWKKKEKQVKAYKLRETVMKEDAEKWNNETT